MRKQWQERPARYDLCKHWTGLSPNGDWARLQRKSFPGHCEAMQVIATHLRADARDVRDIDWSVPTAVVLGNEREGEMFCRCTRFATPPEVNQGCPVAWCCRTSCNIAALPQRGAGDQSPTPSFLLVSAPIVHPIPRLTHTARDIRRCS